VPTITPPMYLSPLSRLSGLAQRQSFDPGMFK
jgi:hypothetical protein